METWRARGPLALSSPKSPGRGTSPGAFPTRAAAWLVCAVCSCQGGAGSRRSLDWGLLELGGAGPAGPWEARRRRPGGCSERTAAPSGRATALRPPRLGGGGSKGASEPLPSFCLSRFASFSPPKTRQQSVPFCTFLARRMIKEFRMEERLRSAESFQRTGSHQLCQSPASRPSHLWADESGDESQVPDGAGRRHGPATCV